MKAKLNAGRLNQRVRIEKPIITQDPDTGALVETIQIIGTVFASIEPLSAREFIAAQSTQSQITAKILMRYRTGLTADMRLVHVATGMIYNPAGFLPDPYTGRDWITIPCVVA